MGAALVAGVALGFRPPLLSAALDLVDPAPWEAVLVGVISVGWVLFLAVLIATERGRSYVMEDADGQLVQDNIDSRMDSLTIAGLVLAGLAVGPAGLAGSAGTFLTLAFAAFMIAWAAGFFPERTSSTLVRDAMHWIGLACLLGGVHAFASGLQLGRDPARIGVMLGTVIVGIYSGVHARGHFRGAFGRRKPVKGRQGRARRAV